MSNVCPGGRVINGDVAQWIFQVSRQFTPHHCPDFDYSAIKTYGNMLPPAKLFAWGASALPP